MTWYQSNGDTRMTKISDVVRKAETRLCDRRCLRDPEEQERAGSPLPMVYIGAVDAIRST